MANIRRQMKAGNCSAPVSPGKPTVLTFYLGLYEPKKSAGEQGSLGRARLLGTTYKEYEDAVLSQMTRQFAEAGFDARKDVAGVILNRWGHARLVQPPDWYYGASENRLSAREIVAAGTGRSRSGTRN